MKKWLTLFPLLLISIPLFSQNNELYNLAFSNTENFKLLKIMDDEIPTEFLIIDSTIIWNPNIFYLENLDLNDPKTIEKIDDNEHHVYHSLYAFRNLKLNDLIDDNEKKELSKKAKSITSKNINLQGNNFKTLPKFDGLGFYFLVSEPLISSNGK